MPDPFGSFNWICSHTPLPQCNLFFSQLWHQDSYYLTTLFPSSSGFYQNYSVTTQSVKDDPNVQTALRDAGTGVGSDCVIARVNHRDSLGDIALIILAGLSFFVAIGLYWHAGRRKAAVGRIEIQLLILAYALHSALTTITMTSVLQQGSTALSVLSAIQVATIAALFWILLGNALVATQVVEDGTPAALVPLVIFAVLFFGPTLYVALDTTLGWTDTLRSGDVKSIALFIPTLIWPALASLLYVCIMLYVTIGMLHEVKPAMFYILSAVLFVAAQLVFFLASQPLCDASDGKVNSAFISVLLDTAALGALYYAWKIITEDDWEYGI